MDLDKIRATVRKCPSKQPGIHVLHFLVPDVIVFLLIRLERLPAIRLGTDTRDVYGISLLVVQPFRAGESPSDYHRAAETAYRY